MCSPSPIWWPWIQQYVGDRDLDWALWPLNGTQGPGYGRSDGVEETFGVLNTVWTGAATESYLEALQSMMPARLAP
jgi:endoglucanase